MTEATQPESSPEDTEITFRKLMEGCNDLHKQIQSLAERLAKIAYAFESVGDAKSHAEGTGLRHLAELRDHADFCLNLAARDLNSWAEMRAETSRSPDLVCDVVGRLMGDGSQCIKLIETYYRMMGDDTEGTGEIDAETFPDQFLWDLAERVEAFPKFAERYPKHLHFAARHLQGLPLLVSHHLDVTHEFDRLSALLGMGTWHPLDVSPRRKRGAITPAMRYLEPVVWRMDNMRRILTEIGEREGLPIPSDRISGLFTRRRAESVPEAEIEIYRNLPELPDLIKSSAPAWSKKAIVPYILVTDGADPANAEHPFLRNIWNHRDVKSTATFRSRLESAVTDFLTRYSREHEPM
jgi:hypothetical protein